ncbi:ABC transporter substrate-binding protein [Thermorudis peleae]|uniref:ABC transporter substrate-binding protein n=1 Tax=Thermorudis peleae TaxID=1382356 RepID=UPI0006899AA8|nr:extracellular solute-binding protein [Thermorudis peleae]
MHAHRVTRRMFLRTLALGLGASGAAGLLSACGGGATPTATPTTGMAAAQASPAATATSAAPAATQAAATPTRAATTSQPVKLTLLEHQKPRVDLLKSLLPKFEDAMKSQGKNITVELQEGPAEDSEFYSKLTLDFSAGTAADVTSFGYDRVAQFASSGYLLDLTQYVNAWPDWKAHFYEKLRQQVTQSDGKVYAIPREATIMELFYRKDILTQLNIPTTQPQSWKELLDRMTQATKATGKPSLLFPAGESWGGGTFAEGFIHLMLGTDSSLYQNGKWVVRSPGLTAVFTFYQQMVEAGVLPVQPLLNPEPWVPTKYQAFPKGDLLCTTGGTWSWIFDWGPKGAAPIDGLFDKVATWQFPTQNGNGTFVYGAVGWVWAASAKTKYPDAAWELIKWLASGEAMAQNAVTIGAAAPRDDIQSIAPYSQMPFLIDAEKQLTNSRSFSYPPGTDKIEQAVGEATQAVITKAKNGQQAADQFAQQATQLLGSSNVTTMS